MTFARFETNDLTFWSRPYLVGATDADVLANDRDELPAVRKGEIRCAMWLSANALIQREPMGCC